MRSAVSVIGILAVDAAYKVIELNYYLWFIYRRSQ
jgi:hypothetical protein